MVRKWAWLAPLTGAPGRAKWCAPAHQVNPKRGVSVESIVRPPDEDRTTGQGGQSRWGELMLAKGVGLIELCQIERLPVVKWLWPLLGWFGVGMLAETWIKVLAMLSPLRMRLPSGLTTVKALCRAVLATNASTSLRHIPSQFSVAVCRACCAPSARPEPRGPAA